MRVLFVSQHLYPRLGGAEHTAMTVLQSLSAAGWTVQAVCEGPPAMVDAEGVCLRRVPDLGEMARAAVAFRPDIVLTQLQWAWAAVQVARQLGVPSVLVVMSYEHFCFDPVAMTRCDRVCATCPVHAIEPRLLATHARMLGEVDQILGISEYVSGIAREFSGRSDVVTWYQPMDFQHLREMPLTPDAPDGNPARRFITLPTPAPFKGLHTVAALARLLPHREFLLVGRTNPADYGEDLAALPNVRCSPPMAPADYFAQTRVLLAPAVWPEPFGRTPLEAMACGVPVIASRVGGLPEAVGDAGILVDDFRDPLAWGAAVEGLLASPAREAQLVARGRLQCRRFEKTRQMPILMAMMENLVNFRVGVPA